MRSKTRSGKKSGQMQYELDGMIESFKGITSYLEVGARYGDTFFDVMKSLPVGARGVCVDHPGNVWGSNDTLRYLHEACDELIYLGYDITIILGDSQRFDTILKAYELAPFDACLIDADHRYEGCMKDWHNYGCMANMVAFHDIVGHGQRHSKGVNVEVPRVWEEIKGDKYKEIIEPGSKMGIGIKWNT